MGGRGSSRGSGRRVTSQASAKAQRERKKASINERTGQRSIDEFNSSDIDEIVTKARIWSELLKMWVNICTVRLKDGTVINDVIQPDPDQSENRAADEQPAPIKFQLYETFNPEEIDRTESYGIITIPGLPGQWELLTVWLKNGKFYYNVIRPY